jgi:hypothetical protein
MREEAIVSFGVGGGRASVQAQVPQRQRVVPRVVHENNAMLAVGARNQRRAEATPRKMGVDLVFASASPVLQGGVSEPSLLKGRPSLN